MTATQDHIIAELQRANAELRRGRDADQTERDAAVAQKSALAEVLDVINHSPGDPRPVFDAILDGARVHCGAEMGTLQSWDGEYARVLARHGYSDDVEPLMVPIGRPFRPGVGHLPVLRGERFSHVLDATKAEVRAGEDEGVAALIERSGTRTWLLMPLRRDEGLIGFIGVARWVVRAFTDAEIVMLENFAAQAVIAMENARLITETREALEQQTATAEVLQVINASPGNPQPVFDAILEKAHALCGAVVGSLQIYDGVDLRAVASHGFPDDYAALIREPHSPNSYHLRLIEGDRFVHFADLKAIDLSQEPDVAGRRTQTTDVRSTLTVPLRRDGVFIGYISAFRREVRLFSDKEIALLESFATQAVIAMENARLITETREALEQQTATAEVLQVINANPGNLTPVFDAILEKAIRVCESDLGTMHVFEDGAFYTLATRNVPPRWDNFLRAPMRPTPGIALERLIQGEDVVHVRDVLADPLYDTAPLRRAFADLSGARTAVWVALRRDDQLLGVFIVYRQEVRPFSDKQIALLRSFAAQAVIAMESARLLNELRARTDELGQRQAELRITFENMGDGVAMFDETQHLVAWNARFQDLLEVPDEIIARRQTFTDYVRYLAERGEYGPDADPDEQIRRLTERAGEYRAYERTRPNGRFVEIRHNPIPSGGFVLIYADITERKRNEEALRVARDAAEAALRELKVAQANLIQAEKMASLGQLTAGIAHEIKNPLNFVNNFSALSTELIDELREVLAPEPLSETVRTEVGDLIGLLKSNLQKVVQHGQRADGIVKAMLEHSRGASGERRTVDINALAEEALNLAYHGARASNEKFNITLERDFGVGIAPIELNPQDMTRVLLNLLGNGFYAASQRASCAEQPGFDPTLQVTTRAVGDTVEIRVRDNGIGVPADIRDKLFQPFFTTKPSGQGTGLGLSIAYDIVTKAHGGTIAVDSEVDAFTEFVVTLPRVMFTNEASRT